MMFDLFIGALALALLAEGLYCVVIIVCLAAGWAVPQP
jgi:hypothetical protein